ncbi:MAG TPA: VOC family protein, partial [Candidatus Limnocylindria bacterium]|nr:VOC family protein [Candidatus Limnocylindria bacterium]
MRGRTKGHTSADRWARHDWWGATIDTPDPLALARFYATLLDWEVTGDDGDRSSAAINPGEGVAYVGFEQVDDYEPPVWPGQRGKQRMMMHLSFEVGDLDAAVQHAVELGARLA